MKHLIDATLRTLVLIGACSVFSVFTLTTANANPTVSITTPSGVVKGQVVISATPLADPAGTATLAYAGIKINGISGYAITLSGSGTPDYQNYSFDAAGTADFAWRAGNGNYQFNFDTTRWPTGSYQITVFTKDSSGRTASSSPITLIIPRALPIALNVDSVVGNSASLSIRAFEKISMGSGRIILTSSSEIDGNYREVASFSATNDGYVTNYTFTPGEWVRAEFVGSSDFLNSYSSSSQLVMNPKVVCQFNRVTRVRMKNTGTCSSSVKLNGLTVLLQTNSGKGWVTIAQGNYSGTQISPSVTPKQVGTLQVRIYSTGLSGISTPFTSNISTIKVSN